MGDKSTFPENSNFKLLVVPEKKNSKSYFPENSSLTPRYSTGLSENFTKFKLDESFSTESDPAASIVDLDEGNHEYRRKQYDYDFYGYGRKSGKVEKRSKQNLAMERKLMWKVPTHSVKIDETANDLFSFEI